MNFLNKWSGWAFAVALALGITIIAFRPFIFNHQIPFPANLLPSFYEPWMSYPSAEYPNGPPNKAIGFDGVRNIYPHRRLITDLLQKGELPLWNPYNFAGNFLLAQYDPAVFHPMTWVFLLLPTINAWSIIVFLTPIFATIGMYGFLRTLGLSKSARLFGSLVFAFSGFMIVWWEETYVVSYTALSLPYILWAIESFRQRPRRITWVILVLLLTISIVSGWFQFTFYGWLFAATFFLIRKPSRKVIVMAACAAGVAGMIAGIHLVPGLETMMQSARTSTDAKYLFDLYLLPFSRLLTLLAPDYWGNPGTYNYFGKGFFYERVMFFGIAPLIFVLYQLFNWRKHTPEERFFAIAFVVTLSLGFSLPTSWFFLYTLKLPFISVIIPSRIFFLTTVCASVLTARAAEHFSKKLGIWPLLFATLIPILGIIAGWGFAVYAKHQVAIVLTKDGDFIQYATISFRNMILPTAITVLVAMTMWLGTLVKKFRPTAFVMLMGISIMGAVFFANKYLYFSDPNLLFPQTPIVTKLQQISGFDRFWTPEHGYMESNFQTEFRLFSPEGYDSFFIRRYGELLDAAKHKGKLQKDIPRADATITSTDTFTDILNDPYRVKLLQLLGVKYIARKNVAERDGPVDIYADPRLRLVWTDQVYQIFEYMEAFPRTFLTTDFITEKNPQTILDRMFSTETNLRKTVILEEEPEGITKSTEKQMLSATITNYSPNRVTVNTSASSSAILFLSDNAYPGWVARIDGHLSKVYRADYTFRGVVVPKGEHRVVFSFEPPSVVVGAILTLAGIIGLVILAIRIRKLE
ncbi:YfhO family protein [Candidatus Gottesmanbacteria bacterium]|nr:YfhO family protein [Candidatus Gottesmanbacteria bacterium]